MSDNSPEYVVAVVGAGPAGLYAARELASNGVQVALFNRDIKPGGLAEYGIYYNKYKMKEGLRKQFRQIVSLPGIAYYGNVTIGTREDISLDELRRMGFQAVLVTVGAQGTKWLGLPGEDLLGVYHAKDLVYHYNQLPPYSEQEFVIGKRAALIGVGNVMMDISHWLVRDKKIDEIVAIARRGPAEVKFTKKEMESVGANLDVSALDAELERVRPVMLSVGQDPQSAREYILSGTQKALEPVSETRLRFMFLASPTRIIGNEDGRVTGLEVEHTTLVLRPDGDTKAKGLGTTEVLDVDTVIFCIGDRVDESFGLPVEWNEFVKNPSPRFPVIDISFEAYDPQADAPIDGVFVAGWARKASEGLVGYARKDGENGAKAVLQYLQTLQPGDEPETVMQRLDQHMLQLDKIVVKKEDWQQLEVIEAQLAQEQGLEAFKFGSNRDMLDKLGLSETSPV